MNDYRRLQSRKQLWSVLAVAAVLFPAAVSADNKPSTFWDTWGDGRAELNGYTLTQPYEGDLRDGKAVLIFSVVNQTPKETPPVISLRAIRNFQTGIYTYSVLSTALARLEDGLKPFKIDTSVQHWSAHSFEQVLIDKKRAEDRLHSDETGDDELKHSVKLPDNVLFEDMIPVLIRELQGPWLAPGQTKDFLAGPSLMTLRLQHKTFEWKPIKVTRNVKIVYMGSVLGKIAVTRWTIETPYQGTFTYWVEVDWPHRIIQWESDQGESGVLTGSTRLSYWKLHKKGDEKYLKELGWLAQ